MANLPLSVVGTHVPTKPRAEGSVHCPDARRAVTASMVVSNKIRIIANLFDRPR